MVYVRELVQTGPLQTRRCHDLGSDLTRSWDERIRIDLGCGVRDTVILGRRAPQANACDATRSRRRVPH